MKLLFLLCFLIQFLPNIWAFGQSIYFPPTNNQAIWETQSPASLGWCTDKIDSLYQFLEQENTKAFLVLKDGRIVLERYFGTFTGDSSWYWASAGKTITAFLIARAQEEGSLNLNQKSNDFLGQGWTSAPLEKENLITIRHQLSMTSGLNDGVPDPYCTLPSCLQYLADAGTRWAYHNAPYTVLDKVLQTATGSNMNIYTQNRLKSQTGMTGLWIPSGYNNVYVSTARSMARFGLLAMNRFKWSNTALLTDTQVINQMTSTSQNLNLSYGYLWWLNGKASYRLPYSQFQFPGPLAPQAPMDLVAGMGKNGQIVAISRSQGLVVVRMGNDPTGLGGEVPNVFLNNLWKNLNKVICNVTMVHEKDLPENPSLIYPNPGQDYFFWKGEPETEINIFDSNQKLVFHVSPQGREEKISTAHWPPGVYFVRLLRKNGIPELKTWVKYP